VINVILFVIGFTILIVVLVTSFPQFNLGLDGFLQQYGITILVIAAAIGAVVIIIGFSKPKKNNKFDFPNPIILPSGNGS
jgi:hypothetical protein